MAPKAKKALEKAKAKGIMKRPGKAETLGKEKTQSGDEGPGKGKAAKAREKSELSATTESRGNGPLKKEDLEKHGAQGKELSIQEKMELAGQEAKDPEEAAVILYSRMSKEEKSKAWSKHQVELRKKTQEEQDAYNALSRREKGVSAAASLLALEGTRYLTCVQQTSSKERWQKTDEWQSHLEMLQRWTSEELEAHLWSGRIISQQCPGTAGVWEYKDTQQWKGVPGAGKRNADQPWKRA